MMNKEEWRAAYITRMMELGANEEDAHWSCHTWDMSEVMTEDLDPIESAEEEWGWLCDE